MNATQCQKVDGRGTYTQAQYEIAKAWAESTLQPSSTHRGVETYRLKHTLQSETGVYMYDADFAELLKTLGFKTSLIYRHDNGDTNHKVWVTKQSAKSTLTPTERLTRQADWKLYGERYDTEKCQHVEAYT